MARVATWLAVAYLLLGAAASRVELGHAAPFLPPGLQAWTWLGQFHMFNEPRPFVATLEAWAEDGDSPRALDVAALYPALRTEGPGYLRARFVGDPARVARLAADLCVRTRPRPDAVRLRLVRRAKDAGAPVPGDVELGRHPCAVAP